MNNVSQSNSNSYHSSQNIKKGHTLKNLINHNYLEKIIAKYKNTIAKINPQIELKEIRKIDPLEKTGLIKVLKNNPLAISLQKLDTTFNWLELENNSITSNDTSLGGYVKNQNF